MSWAVRLPSATSALPIDPCAGVECDGADERCSGGECVSCEADRDGDHFEACVECHDAVPAAQKDSKHARVRCEACHGAQAAHVAGSGDPKPQRSS